MKPGYTILFSLVCALALYGCKGNSGAAGGPPPGMKVSVVAATVQQEPIVESISLVGTLAANELVEIRSEIDGVIEGIAFEEGQNVEKGDVLFKINEEKLSSAVAQADANYRLARANLNRSESLFEARTISSQEYDQARAEYEASRANLSLVRQQLEEATITASFSGVMDERLVSQGQVVGRGDLLSRLISLDPIKVEFNVPEKFLSRVQPGLNAEIRVVAYPDKKFSGEVFFVSPRLDPVTRTALIKARINNEDGLLKPGMFAGLNLNLVVRSDALTISETALMMRGQVTELYVITEEETAELRQVETGVRLPGKIEIVSGVSKGEPVVIEGVQKLNPGAPVNARFNE